MTVSEKEIDRIITSSLNEELQKVINESIAHANCYGVPRGLLEYRKQEGLEMQRKNSLWNQYLATSSRLQAGIDERESTKVEILTQINGFREPSIINAEIDGARNKITEKQTRMVELKGLKNSISSKESELYRVTEDGKKLRKEWSEIDPSKIVHCPTCHQLIQTNPETKAALEKKKEELGIKVEQMSM